LVQQAAKAGQEYIQLQVAVRDASSNNQRLSDLLDKFKGSKSEAEEVEAYFYDKILALRTNIMIMFRNVLWAYKYHTLCDSTVILDPSKEINDYFADWTRVEQETLHWQENFSSDPQRE
jgi:hypothetical protein